MHGKVYKSKKSKLKAKSQNDMDQVFPLLQREEHDHEKSENARIRTTHQSCLFCALMILFKNLDGDFDNRIYQLFFLLTSTISK